LSGYCWVACWGTWGCISLSGFRPEDVPGFLGVRCKERRNSGLFQGRQRRLGEVVFGVAEVVLRVLVDEGEVVIGRGATDFAGDARDQGAWRDDYALGDQRSGGDDAARADARSIEDDGAHADQNVVFQGAAMHGGVMADGAAGPDDHWIQAFHAMQHGAVLHIAASADPDAVYIAAQHGVHPDAGLLAQDDITEHLRGGVDVRGGRDGGRDTSIGAEHTEKSLEDGARSYRVQNRKRPARARFMLRSCVREVS